MGLCEVPHVFLNPNQLYKFVVMPGCGPCARAERHEVNYVPGLHPKRVESIEKRDDEYWIQDMHGRPVIRREVADGQRHECVDCGQPAGYHMFEIRPTDPQPADWFWCGVCDIGG